MKTLVFSLMLLCGKQCWSQTAKEIALNIGKHHIRLPIDEYIDVKRTSLSYSYKEWIQNHQLEFEGSATNEIEVKKTDSLKEYRGIKYAWDSSKYYNVTIYKKLTDPHWEIAKLKDTDIYYTLPHYITDTFTWIDAITLEEKTITYQVNKLKLYFDLTGVSKKDMIDAIIGSLGLPAQGEFKLDSMMLYPIHDSEMGTTMAINYKDPKTITESCKTIASLPPKSDLIIVWMWPIEKGDWETGSEKYNRNFACIHLSD